MIGKIDANILSCERGRPFLRIRESCRKGIRPRSAYRRSKRRRVGRARETKLETNVPEPKSVAAAFKPLLAALMIAAPDRMTVFEFN